LQFLHNKRADALFKHLTKRTMALVAVNVSHKKKKCHNYACLYPALQHCDQEG